MSKPDRARANEAAKLAKADSRMTSLRDLLKTSQVADYFDEMAQMRVGAAISNAVFDPSKPNW